MSVGALPLDRSEHEQRVLEVLHECRGRRMAIGKSDLARRTGIHERTVREIIKHLIEAHGEPIGSTSGDPHGYYMICTADEQQQAEAELQHRIIELARRLASLRKNTPSAVLGQITLELN